jgi:hypothetical protein
MKLGIDGWLQANGKGIRKVFLFRLVVNATTNVIFESSPSLRVAATW